MARPKRFELLTPRFVVWAGPLKSLRSVTVRKPLLAEIGVIQQLLNALRYRKSECLYRTTSPASRAIRQAEVGAAKTMIERTEEQRQGQRVISRGP